jgi:hypothetical protein
MAKAISNIAKISRQLKIAKAKMKMKQRIEIMAAKWHQMAAKSRRKWLIVALESSMTGENEKWRWQHEWQPRYLVETMTAWRRRKSKNVKSAKNGENVRRKHHESIALKNSSAASPKGGEQISAKKRKSAAASLTDIGGISSRNSAKTEMAASAKK